MNVNDVKQKVIDLVNNHQIKVVETFKDDHIICAVVQIHDLKFTLWHVGWEGAASLMYVNDSPSAKKDAIDIFLNHIENGSMFVEGDTREEDPDFEQSYKDDIAFVNVLGMTVDQYFDANIEWGCFSKG